MSADENGGNTGVDTSQQTQMQTPQLVERIEAGDAAAEDELVQRYSKGIQLILIRRTGQVHLAHDLVQETFIIVIRKLRAGELRNPAGLSAFVRQVAINLSIQHFRKEKRYVSQEDGIIELNLAQNDDKASRLDHRAMRQELLSALEQLGVDRDREILRRFYLQDEDKAQICSALELSAAHFDRVLYRAKQRMRQMIEKHAELKALLLGGLGDG